MQSCLTPRLRPPIEYPPGIKLCSACSLCPRGKGQLHTTTTSKITLATIQLIPLNPPLRYRPNPLHSPIIGGATIGYFFRCRSDLDWHCFGLLRCVAEGGLSKNNLALVHSYGRICEIFFIPLSTSPNKTHTKTHHITVIDGLDLCPTTCRHSAGLIHIRHNKASNVFGVQTSCAGVPKPLPISVDCSKGVH